MIFLANFPKTSIPRGGSFGVRAAGLMVSMLCLTGACAPALHAQAAYFKATSAQPVVTGIIHPVAVATDSSGNLYVVTGNSVLKETLANGGFIQSTVASNFSAPTAIAVDGNGDVFVADGSSVYVEDSVGGGYQQHTVLSGLAFPSGLAVDSSGNLFVSVSSGVLEYRAGGGTITVKSGANTFRGLAVDGDGDVYVTDSVGGRVIREEPAGSHFYETPVASGLSSPYGVAVDQVGNAYVANTHSSAVLKETVTNPGASAVYSQSTLYTGTNYIYDVAVDGLGNVYIADTFNNRILRQQILAVDFGPVPIGTRAERAGGVLGLITSTQTLIFQFSTSASLTAGAVVVSTEGVVGKDFKDAGTGTCNTPATYLPGDTCTVDVTFTPGEPGVRSGAAILNDAYGDAMATALLHGKGTGPLVVFDPGTTTTILPAPQGYTSYGLSVDLFGDVFANGQELPAAGGPPVDLGAYAEYGPAGNFAIDGAGNIHFVGNYIFMSHGGVDYYQETVSSLILYQGTYYQGLSSNVYVSDPNHSQLYFDSRGNFYQPQAVGVLEFRWNGNDWDGPLFIAALPTDIISNTEDGFGNLYAIQPNSSFTKTDRTHPPSLSFASTNVGSTSSDSPKSFTIENIGNQPLVFPTPGSGFNPSVSANFALASSTTCPQIGSATPPASLAAGAICSYAVKFVPTHAGPITGSVVLTDNDLNASGPGYSTQTVSLSGTGLPGFGYIVFSPQVANFGNIGVGTKSGPIVVTVTNNTSTAANVIGGQGLGGPDFVFDPGTCNFPYSPLAPGASCSFSVYFNPSALGVVVGSVTYKSASDTVTFQFKGNGVYPRVVFNPSPAAFGNVKAGTTSAPLTISVGNYTGSAATYQSFSNLGNFNFTPGTCGAIGPGTMLAAGGFCQFQVSFSPMAAGPVKGSFTINTAAGLVTYQLSGAGTP